MTRAELVDHARASIAKGSKSFRMASTLFDPVTRERAWLLYAWCRACDDLADGQAMGHDMRRVDDESDRLALIRAGTAAAYGTGPIDDPAFDGLRVVVNECGLSHGLTADLVQGFAMDAAEWRPQTEEDLLRYCYHVAGVVGIMMAQVMGVAADDRDTLARACDLGLAFQLANIARDIAEDAGAGRCYLPAAWLAEFGITEDDIMNPVHRPALARIAGRLAERAARYEASARRGAAALPFRSRWAVLAAAGIYGGIARAVARRGARAWDSRVTTSRAAKLAWVMRAGSQAVWMSFSRHPA